VHRVILSPPGQEINIFSTLITDTRDLFVLVYKIEAHEFNVFCIDLDNSNVSEKDAEDFDAEENLYDVSKPILKYKFSDVEHQPFKQMHVRGSSRKEHINFNQNLILFVLHGDTLYNWISQPHVTQGLQPIEMTLYDYQTKQKSKQKLRISSKFLHPKNDNCFFFRHDLATCFNDTPAEQQVVVFEKIMKCDISTSSFTISTVFIESALTDSLLTFNFDKNKDKIIMFLSSMSNTNSSKLTYKLKVYDCHANRIQYETTITNQVLIGRLHSGMYTFSDGHIYYSNNVIKLRYDLIESVNSYNYTEDDIFDFY